jgi:type IV secretion system protein VirD4
MQLDARDELVLVSGCPPIRARKIRHYEDRAFTGRVLPPPVLDATGSYADRPAQIRPDDWSGRLVTMGSGNGTVPAAAGGPDDDGDSANAGIRREPELPEHEAIAPESEPAREFDLVDDDGADEPVRQQAMSRLGGLARQAALDPDDGMEL